jgi:hypothetical protein
MTIPVSVDSSEYYEQLREFRDSALDASNLYDRRKYLGALVFGSVGARWVSQDGGIAVLEHKGIRFKRSNITRLMPTTLSIDYLKDDGVHDVTTFSMNLDEIGWVDVHKYPHRNYGPLETACAGISKLIDQKNGLQHPTDLQRELIYTELERGASGDFALQ